MGSSGWSPLHAMKAYIHSLQLCKDCQNQDSTTGSSRLLEPKCMEFISALAAGNQARLMIDVASSGMSTSTLALAIAATNTGGRLICIRSEEEDLERAKAQIENFKFSHVVEFKVGNPLDLIKEYNNIDFAVIDQRIKNCFEMFLSMQMNPIASVVVVSNLFHGRKIRVSYAHTVRSRGWNKATILPFGNGMEVTRIGKGSGKSAERISSCKRTFIVYEE